MNDLEMLIEWIADLPKDTRGQIEELSEAELAWQPDPEANSIGVTVWHYSRWLDLPGVRMLQDWPQSEEQWFTRGWATQTNYDPSGIGNGGYGAITGYSIEEMLAIPNMPAEQLLTYLDQVCNALVEQLEALPVGGLHQPAPGLGTERTPYQWMKIILKGALRHQGEIETLKSLHARQVHAASP